MSLDQSADQHYRNRVARVIAHIVAHPLAAHRLEDLAAIAHFSPFHFHRVYSSIAGETVAATVRRVRLALATRLLEQGGQKLAEALPSICRDAAGFDRVAFHQVFNAQVLAFFQRHIAAAKAP